MACLFAWNSLRAESIRLQVVLSILGARARYQKSINAWTVMRKPLVTVPSMTDIIYHTTLQCSWPVTCFSFEIPSLNCWNPAPWERRENLKSISSAPKAWMHHLMLWSQKALCQWHSGSGVKKVKGLEPSQSLQNSWLTPFNQYFIASQTYWLRSSRSALQ